MQNVELACAIIFQKLDIPAEFVYEAKTAFKKHSQKEIFGSSALNKDNLISSEEWSKINQLFELFCIPINVDTHIKQFAAIVH